MEFLQLIYSILLRSCIVRACIALVLAGVFCFVLRIFYQKTARCSDKSKHFLNTVLLEAIYRPLLIFAAVIGTTYALQWFCVDWKLESIDRFHFLRNLFFIGFFAWFSWNAAFLYAQAFLKRNIENRKIDSTLIYALNHIARIIIVIVTAISLFQLFGLSIAGVLAFGGMGGIVIGFASKDLLANVFGSLMLFLDRPFVIGDQIVIPNLPVEGEVKDIGWRVCRVLTPNGYPVYIPNALFSNLLIENRSRANYRRFYCSISLRYQDLEKLPTILKDIRLLLSKNPAIDKTRAVNVNLRELANTSLNISVEAYTAITNDSDFLAMQQTLYLALLDCVHYHGAQWAFPSYSIFLNTDTEESKQPVLT